MHKLNPISVSSAIEEQGRARLMLRIPQHRQAFAGASSEVFLDICEAYELTWSALGHWARSPAAERADRLEEYRAILAELEFEAAQYAAPGNEKKPGLA